MTSQAKIDLRDKSNSDKFADCHLLPCKIAHTGEAQVSKYFKPLVVPDQEESGAFKSSFRGRPLCGSKVSVPPGYRGAVLAEENQEGSGKALVRQKEFQDLTLWQWDKKSSHPSQQSLDWLKVAKAIHQKP